MTARSSPRPSRLAGVLLGVLGVALCGVLLAWLTVRHVLWPRLDEWRPQILAQVERSLGRPVAATALRPGWDGLHPSLAIEGLRIDGPDGAPRLAVDEAFARVSWRSLAFGAPRLAVLRLQAPRLVVERLAPGRFAIAGFELAGEGPSDGRGLDWLLSQGDLDVIAASLRLVDRTGAFAPLEAEGVSISLHSTGRRHAVRFDVARPGDAARALSGVAEFYRPPLRPPSDWRRWRGEAHVSGLGVDLARVAGLADALGVALPPPAAGAEGVLDALAWLRFDESRLEEATLKLRAERAATSLPEGRLAVEALAAELRAQRRRDGGTVLTVSGLSATDPRGFSLAADGDAELAFDAGHGLRRAWLRLKAFDAAAALEAARRLPLPPAAHERLRPIALDGDVRDLTLRWVHPDAPPTEARPADRSADAGRAEAPRFELSAQFDRLSLALGEAADGRRLPGFTQLSGSVRASGGDGALVLAGRRSTLSLPGVFTEPTLELDRLDAELAWRVDPDSGALRIEVPRFAFANADARGAASGYWQSGGRGPGLVDLSGRVERVDVSRVPRYLPVKLPERTREWVEHAVLAGTADDLRFEVRGDLWDFPFRRPEEGRFRLAAKVREATLAYAPQWPRIERIRGDLVFEGAGFEIRAQSGVVEGVKLTDVHARLPDYEDSLLTIDGRGAGPAQQMLAFVNASPLASTASTFTRDLQVDGDARLALKLTLPLKDLPATRVAGTVDFPGNDVALDRTLPTFGGVAGRLEFTEHGIALPELRATLLGGPIRLTGRPAGEGRMKIEASGAIDAAGMRSLVDNPLTRRLDGRTEYRASVDVDRRASTLRIESDLVGLASTLPAPFAKAGADRWPLRVVSRPLAPPAPGARPPGDRLEVRLGERAAFAFERERDAGSERLVVRRAGFAVDAEPALRDAGFSVLVRAPALDLDAWRAVLGDGELERLERVAGGGAVPGLSLVPDLVSVVADDLRIGGRDLHEVVLGASRTGDRWRANIASREIEGHFDWRDARPGERTGTLTARFARLALPRSRVGEVESALSASPAQLPGLDVSADELVLGNVSLGALTLSATNGGTPAQPVWKLDRLVVTNPAARLEARGAWSFARVAPGRPAAGAPTAALGASPPGAGPADPRSTELDFSLQIADAGRLLDRLGVRDTVRGGTGTLTGRVQWDGSPLAIDYGSLEGEMALALGKGEFLKVDPGIAKLIGVLNMQSLPKRLSGDFRDLFAEGFAFDSIGGDLRIRDGIARTADLRMRGLQAQVTIRGEADLQRETQRLNVEVVPELNAGLASIAVGAMINPVVGLGSFAAQYVLKKPLQEVLAYDVDVTGSWSDPMVSERNRRALAPRPAASP